MNPQLTADQLKALRLLGSMTRDWFNPSEMAGKHMAGNRAFILSLLVGKRLPQSKASWTAFRESFYALADSFTCDSSGECEAEREDRFARWVYPVAIANGWPCRIRPEAEVA